MKKITNTKVALVNENTRQKKPGISRGQTEPFTTWLGNGSGLFFHT